MRKLWWAPVVLVWAIVGLMLVLPYGGQFLEYCYLGIPVLAVTVLCAILIARKWKSFKEYLACGCVLFGALVSYFLITTVSFRNDIAGASIDGTIVKVGRSRNHNYPAIEIADDRGTTTRFEAVSEQLLTALPSDRISKRRGARSGTLNGQPVEFLELSPLDVFRLP